MLEVDFEFSAPRRAYPYFSGVSTPFPGRESGTGGTHVHSREVPPPHSNNIYSYCKGGGQWVPPDCAELSVLTLSTITV